MSLANPEAPAQPLYSSPWGLLPFQAEAVAYALLRENNLVVYDTGIGKTHIGMATAAMLFEDGLIDLCLVVCERNKLTEWDADLERFTRLTHRVYKGAPTTRRRILDDLPQVLIGTYETVRNDAAHPVAVNGRKTKRLAPHFLAEAFAGQRVLMIFDEMTKLGNRSSQNHKHHATLINHLRSCAVTRVMGLTATPVENGPENLYNLGRILTPATVGTVDSFEHDHVEARDIYGNVVKWKNIPALAQKLAPVMLRKRKTDPDVIEQFPRRVEEVTYVDLDRRHLEFYDTVDGLFRGADDASVFTILRQIAGHPASLVRSESEISRTIVREVGEAGLRALGSTKLDRLVEYLQPLVEGQGAQAVIFTFFGQSVLPLIQERLEECGYSVAVNHGQLSQHARDAAQATFRAGQAQIFLTSDAGQRGINLPEASYAIHYELPLTYAAYVQRSDRIHRIDSTHPSVTVMSFIARGTVEEAIAGLILKRNQWSDALLDADADEEGFVSAAHRREILRLARS
jgi:SNF2 family DNA or RNA helicase